MSWFDLGKYTPYIWTAYGIAAVVLTANIVAAVRRTRRTRQRLRDYFRHKGARS
jgi:heme exporter protein CcmD